jgi:hypothetical protein
MQGKGLTFYSYGNGGGLIHDGVAQDRVSLHCKWSWDYEGSMDN